ncbi:MAG: hypothetical protein AAGM38_13300, partial [Pseudomonadota bacterium]
CRGSASPMMADEISVPLSIVLQGVVFPALFVVWRELARRQEQSSQETTRRLDLAERKREEDASRLGDRLSQIERDSPQIYATKAELKVTSDELAHNVKGLRRDQAQLARDVSEAISEIREIIVLLKRETGLIRTAREDDGRRDFRDLPSAPRRRRRKRALAS